MLIPIIIKIILLQNLVSGGYEIYLRDYLLLAKSLEVNEYYTGNIKIQVEDRRRFQGHQIELSELDFLSYKDNSKQILLNNSILPTNKVVVDIEYLGFYQTSTGVWGAKSIININSAANWNVKEYRDVVNVDVLYGKSRRLNRKLELDWGEDFIGRVQKMLDNSISKALVDAPDYKFVRTYG